MAETIEGRLEQIQTDLDYIKELTAGLPILADIANLKLVGVSQLAEIFGLSKTALYSTHAWMLPDFGRVARGRREWTLGEVLEWNKQGAEALKERYINLGLEDEDSIRK